MGAAKTGRKDTREEMGKGAQERHDEIPVLETLTVVDWSSGTTGCPSQVVAHPQGSKAMTANMYVRAFCVPGAVMSTLHIVTQLSLPTNL